MTQPILIFGEKGSMGLRYKAIFKYLSIPTLGVDLDDSPQSRRLKIKQSEGFVIATPTADHMGLIHELLPEKKPILCEKPVVKSVEEIKLIRERVEKESVPFRMMFQYSLLADRGRVGKSRYDFFRHGSDGLVWDCLQIIGLARGEVELREESPIWSCVINGKPLSIGAMDAAYVAYVQRWLKKPEQDMGMIQAIHERTAEAAAKHG
jgi:hypothetical protein